ncbi:sugar transport protein 5-like [Neltuma alba]|uniref:sugar transport protein 5-like n=1 Tax=Neltuma alba TaxID=207710 RepID=UPI0010A44D3D|nr:sugar transport protein 5-like [Prosopis alba]XP_028760344.1 sugar transport protein 5-like [Prosopis alba]
MAVGGFAVDAPSNSFGGEITLSVVITCIVAASSGLIFGYDIGISGGVTTMAPFLEKFFPAIQKKSASTETSVYCVYDSQVLTLFTSSLYLAGLVSSLAASRVTAKVGRRNTMILGGCSFLAGGAINGGAENIAMLILGRILLGLGVGFTNQAAPVYLSEIAPPKWRGAFNTGFQFFIGVGVVAANCINYATSKHPWGWRLSLGLAVAPAVIMTVGAFLITDTPSSLVQRGKTDQARNALRKVRGPTADVEGELDELVKWTEKSKALQQEPFTTIFERQYRPHLVMAIAIPFFQQVTGINIVAFYSPNLFQSVGFGNGAALLSTIILGVVNIASLFVSTFVVDRFGRRFLFIIGGIQMVVCQVAVTVVLALARSTQHISKSNATLVLVLLCLYAAGFGWSWGPLSWLIPSEIFPLKIRTTGQSISIAVNFLTTFVLSQTFLSMLCRFKYGAFLFFAAWIALMTVFIVLCLPETKGIPLESMHAIWRKHWLWHRFVAKRDDQNNLSQT